MIKIGIVGLGLEWDTLYLPALRSLGPRAQVRAIYDPVASRAQLAAAQLPNVAVSDGILVLADRSDVDALLALESGWQLQAMLPHLCTRRKPVLLAGGLHCNVPQLEHLHATAVLTGTTLMPEFRWRYTPATNRLQELLATCLGAIRQMRLQLPASRNGQPAGQLSSAIDWISYVLRSRPRAVTRPSLRDSSRFELEFPAGPRSLEQTAVGVEAALPLPPPDRAAAADSSAHSEWPTIEVECERGRVRIGAPDRLTWQLNAGPLCEEILEGDRPPLEVLLDHFCRRVVGGLIPVADLRDACRSLWLAQSIDQWPTTIDRLELPDMPT